MTEIEHYEGIDKAEAFTGLSKSTIYHYCSEGKMPGYKIGSRLLFKISELEKWMAAQRIGPDGGSGGQ